MNQVSGLVPLRLSILIPTFCRYGRLFRGLSYLNEISSHPEFQSLFQGVEVLIADGTHFEGMVSSEEELRLKVLSLVDKLNGRFRVSFFSQPGRSLQERFAWLSTQASAPYVTMLGDEDMLAFDSVEKWLDELDLNPDVAAITGHYVDIKGFARLGSRLSIRYEEGLVYGCNIDALDVRGRLLQHLCLGLAGLPPISYSLMRKEIFANFSLCLLGSSDFDSYCGAEALLATLMVSAGEVRIKDLPYVFRDFTYMNHSSSEAQWSDPVKDKKALVMAIKQVNKMYGCFGGDDDIAVFVDQLNEIGGYGRPAWFSLLGFIAPAQKALSRIVRKKINPISLRCATMAWQSTALICYGKNDLKAVGFVDFSVSSLAEKFLQKLKPRA